MNIQDVKEMLSLYQLRNVFAAYHISECWYVRWIDKKSLHAKTRAVVVFDRVINNEISRMNNG